MPDDLKLEIDLTDPRAGYRPNPPVLSDLGDDAKTIKMERAVKEDHLEHLRTSVDRVRQVVADRLDSARPRRERAEQEIERVLEEERKAFEDKWKRRAEWLQARAEKAEKGLPDLGGTNG